MCCEFLGSRNQCTISYTLYICTLQSVSHPIDDVLHYTKKTWKGLSLRLCVSVKMLHILQAEIAIQMLSLLSVDEIIVVETVFKGDT